MQKNIRKKKLKIFITSAVVAMSLAFVCNVSAAENTASEVIVESSSPSLLSITGESHIYPIEK